MAINVAILKSNFEIIRDRIAEILRGELILQAELTGEAYLNAPVKTELIGSVSPRMCLNGAFINVMTLDNQYSARGQNHHRCETTYYIEVYSFAENTSEDSGDELSASINWRLQGVINKILSHPSYVKLGFESNFIENITLRDTKRAVPRNEDDSNAMAYTYSELVVRHQEQNTYEIGAKFSGSSTKIENQDIEFNR